LDARNAGAVVIFGTVAAISTAVYFATDQGENPAPLRAPPGVGYYARNVRLTGTGSDGKLSYNLTAERATQTVADGSVHLERVQVKYAPAADAPWNLLADSGRISAGADIIELNGNVVAASAAEASPATTIRTDSLRYDPATGVAETDGPVTILYASSVVHAQGLRARLREGRLDLLGQVHGRYEP
jgi:lipopolysaccharide export system protein LptC